MSKRPRIAVVGHVEHVTVGRVPSCPKPGEIAHLESPRSFPGGGGGVTFFQLARSNAELLLFTALGNDEAADFVEERIAATGASVHAARRDEPHTRDVVLVTPEGERTILVVGRALHPAASDPLPWEELATCDAVYFCAEDPAVLRHCRQAQRLIVTARRQPTIRAAAIAIDAIVGSIHDAREKSRREDYAIPPSVLVMTAGAEGGAVMTATGATRFAAPKVDKITGGAYGAGDSFLGAFAYYLTHDLDPTEAAERAAHHGAAVLQGLDPIQHQLALEIV